MRMSPVKVVKAAFERHPALLGSMIGACLGFLLLRPYTLLIYRLSLLLEVGSRALQDRAAIEGPHAFKFLMLLTSVSFVFFGGVVGLVFGKWYDRKQKHVRERIERQKREAAIETLKELTVTLSHYIINASSIIRGFAQRGRFKANEERIKEYFSIIEEEAEKNIAVIKGLESLREIKPVKYVDSGTEMMIDLKKEINEQLGKIKAMNREA